MRACAPTLTVFFSNKKKASLHGAALVHAITGNTVEACGTLTLLRGIVEEDWARRRGKRGRMAAATEGTSHASLVVMEALEAYLAAARVRIDVKHKLKLHQRCG